jgi:hypothetical protein
MPPDPQSDDPRWVRDRFLAFETTINWHRAVATCVDEPGELDLLGAFADSINAT